MKTYEVIIRATITKSILVDAETEQAATERAHELFSVLEDSTDESYEQGILRVEEIK